MEMSAGGLATVREALQVPSLAGASVVAGKAGLSRIVRSVTVGEVPDIADWLEGGELVLSTLYAVAKDQDARLAFVQDLIARRAAGLLTKPGRFVGELDAAIVASAKRADFPVVVVDEAARWTDVVREIYELALGKRAAELALSESMHRDLVQVAAQGGDFARLAESANRLIDRPVAIADERGQVLAVSPARETLRLAPPRVLAEAVGSGEAAVRTPPSPGGGHSAAVTLPVLVGGLVLGAVGTTEIVPLTALEMVALEHTATVAAILFGREQVRSQTELRLKGDFLSEVATGKTSAEELGEQARRLGLDVRHGVIALGVRLTGTPAGPPGGGLERGLAALVAAEHGNALVAAKADDVIALLGGTAGVTGERLDGLATAISGRIDTWLTADRPDRAFVAAASDTHPASGLSAAVRELQVALAYAERTGSGDRLTRYADVGTFRLLLGIADTHPAELRRFAEETVGPLSESGSGLVETLEAYLDLDGNVGEVAKRLFLHRHTVRYRLDRIADLTGLDVKTSEGRERLGLGLKAARLVRRLGDAGAGETT